LFVGAGIGAGVTGFVAMIAAQSGEHNVVGWVIAIWVILAAAGLGSALARMYRGRKR
jgi:amino acid transporter